MERRKRVCFVFDLDETLIHSFPTREEMKDLFGEEAEVCVDGVVCRFITIAILRALRHYGYSTSRIVGILRQVYSRDNQLCLDWEKELRRAGVEDEAIWMVEPHYVGVLLDVWRRGKLFKEEAYSELKRAVEEGHPAVVATNHLYGKDIAVVGGVFRRVAVVTPRNASGCKPEDQYCRALALLLKGWGCREIVGFGDKKMDFECLKKTARLIKARLEFRWVR